MKPGRKKPSAVPSFHSHGDTMGSNSSSWNRGLVSFVTNDAQATQVEVREASNTKKVVITEKGVLHTGEDGHQYSVYHNKDKCREPNCVQCLFAWMDAARLNSKDEKIGQGTQGLVHRFMGPNKKWYVRKDVVMAQNQVAPVMSRLIDENTKYGLAASVEGEVNRMFHSGPHIVTLYGSRLYKNPAPVNGSSGTEADPIVIAPSTTTIEFVMEYMDWTVEDVQKAASLVEQRVLNRLLVHVSPASPDPFDFSATSAAVVGVLAMVTCHTPPSYSFSVPFFRCHPYGLRHACGCQQRAETVLHAIEPKLDDVRSDSGVLPEVMVLNIFKQVACSFERLQQCCIIHKDIKPSNILVDKTGRVKLADFGTSKRGKKQDTRVTVTTPCAMSTRIYKAPELAGVQQSSALDASSLAAGDGEVDAGLEITSAADVWSLGLTMLVISTPTVDGPWQKDLLNDPFYHPTCISDFRVPATLSEEFRRLLAKCLAFKPGQRPVRLAEEECLKGCDCKIFSSSGPSDSSVLGKYIEGLMSLTNPAEEARKLGVKQELDKLNISPLDTTGPKEFSQWCDSALEAVAPLFETIRNPQKVESSSPATPLTIGPFPAAGGSSFTLGRHQAFKYMRKPCRRAPHLRGHHVNHVSFRPPSVEGFRGLSYPPAAWLQPEPPPPPQQPQPLTPSGFEASMFARAVRTYSSTSCSSNASASFTAAVTAKDKDKEKEKEQHPLARFYKSLKTRQKLMKGIEVGSGPASVQYFRHLIHATLQEQWSEEDDEETSGGVVRRQGSGGTTGPRMVSHASENDLLVEKVNQQWDRKSSKQHRQQRSFRTSSQASVDSLADHMAAQVHCDSSTSSRRSRKPAHAPIDIDDI